LGVEVVRARLAGADIEIAVARPGSQRPPYMGEGWRKV